MSDSVTRTKPYVPKRQHIVTDERREHRQSPASPEGGSPEASPGGGWKRSAFAISRVVARVGGAHALKPPCCISTSISKLLASSTSRSGLLASRARMCTARASRATRRARAEAAMLHQHVEQQVARVFEPWLQTRLNTVYS